MVMRSYAFNTHSTYIPQTFHKHSTNIPNRYDDKVGKYWPEFSKHGKRFVTIAEVMRHEGGVPFFTDPKDLSDVKKDRKTCIHNPKP